MSENDCQCLTCKVPRLESQLAAANEKLNSFDAYVRRDELVTKLTQANKVMREALGDSWMMAFNGSVHRQVVQEAITRADEIMKGEK